MPLISTRRRCFVCNKFMEVGEKFVWGDMRAQGVDRKLPMHPEHDTNFSLQKSKLDAVIEEAAANGHGNPEHYIQGDVALSEQSVIAELKNEIERGKKWGYGYVTHDRLESLIRKHEIQVPGDTTHQPGEWQIRGGNVEAIQCLNDIESVAQVIEWVTSRGGKIEIKDGEPPYLKLDSPREPNIVNATWWVVKTADGMFYTMPDSDFHTIYVPRSE